MQLIDTIRAIIRFSILPFINIIGTADKSGILTAERLSPLILLMPAAAYGCGYQTGRKIRTQIHTVISDNDRKRIRREKRRRNAGKTAARDHSPEKLN